MKRLFVQLLFISLLSARAEAHFEQSSSVARSQAAGGTFVSIADDASGLFVNPAGTVPAARAATYLDYAEPPGRRNGRESRLAVAAGAGRTGFGLGWYRLGADSESENLFILNSSQRLLEGSQGSFVSLGANLAVGSVSHGGSLRGENGSWSKMTGDAGLIVRPLPVISFGYSIGNIRDAHPGGTDDDESWRRVQRWGVSYFWEDRIVLSFAEEHRAGRTTVHYGLSVKTAVPMELATGFSDGHVTGGARYTGSRFSAMVSFSADEMRRITWTGSCEVRVGKGANGEAP